MPAPPPLYTTPATVPMLDAVANRLLSETRGDPLALAEILVLLPTRRAVRGLAQAFFRASGGRAVLLPELRAIGDLDEEALELSGLAPMLPVEATAQPGGPAPLPPAIHPLRRQALLTRLVMEAGSTFAAEPAQAWMLAEALATFLDEVQAHALDFDTLAQCGPTAVQAETGLAEHWQQAIAFLAIVFQRWPRILAQDERAMDPIARRLALIGRQTEAWRQRPVQRPVLVAGMTGTLPAIQALMQVVLQLPQGRVVLPGLDRDLDPQAWQVLPETHPQAPLRATLRALGHTPADVQPWPPQAPLPDPRPARTALLRAAFDPGPAAAVALDPGPAAAVALDPGPAAAVAADNPWPGPAALEGVSLVEAADPDQEAALIALLLREALETPGRTAALVTPDRQLSRRVRVHLQRHGVDIADSAGVPLDQTAVGIFLRQILAVAADPGNALSVLALLKQPQLRLGKTARRLDRLVRWIERCWRRAMPFHQTQASLHAELLRAAQPQAPDPDAQPQAPDPDAQPLAPDPDADDRPRTPVTPAVKTAVTTAVAAPVTTAASDAADLLAALQAAIQPLALLLMADRGGVDLARLLVPLIQAAEALALRATSEADGSVHPWVGEDGEAAARLLGELMVALDGVPSVPALQVPDLMAGMLAQVTVRPRGAPQPRLALLGLIEARGQQPDVMILGGMVDGVWPPEPPADPWLSRPLRAAFGLPMPELRIGQSAHDFVQAASAPIVVLTRAMRQGGVQTVPSRFLVRLEAAARRLGMADGLARAPGHRLARWLAALDQPDAAQAGPVPRPAPCPPLALRPRTLSVTAIEQLMEDPYAFYARHILRLEPLPTLTQELDALERGTLIHESVHAFLQATRDRWPADPYAVFLAGARQVFAQALERPQVRGLWWPRLERLAAWFVDWEVQRRKTLELFATERSAEWAFQTAGGAVTLRARMDRVDVTQDGAAYALIDFKTGTPPELRDMASGHRAQLPLSALILQKAGMAGPDPVPRPRPVAKLSVVTLTGRRDGGDCTSVSGSDLDDLLRRAERGLIDLIDAFDDPRQPYLAQPDPRRLRHTSAVYGWLARAGEWGAAAGQEDAEP